MAKQVLVIDDDRNTVKYLTVALSENGYDPVSASDGKDGMQKIRLSKPDLIVLDVMMPGRTGFVLVKQLKRDEQLREIPVLMISGAADVLEELDDDRDDDRGDDRDDGRDDAFESPHDNLRESLKKKIKEMREGGSFGPEMFIDKPVSPDAFIEKVQELIGT